MRAFLAIDLPDALRRRLAELQQELRGALRGVRWTRPDSIHLTLVFLGEIGDAAVEGVGREAAELCARCAPGRALARGLGWFPPRGSPRILWVGVAPVPPDPLPALHAGLEEAAERAGVPRERRPFRPHLTLGRATGRLSRADVERALHPHAGAELGELPVERCTLFRSILGPGGARYEPRARWTLGG